MADCVSESSSAAALKFSNLAVASKALSGPNDKVRVLCIDMAASKRSITVGQLNLEDPCYRCLFNMNQRRFFHWTGKNDFCNISNLDPKVAAYEYAN
jgi:hypothetical protein